MASLLPPPTTTTRRDDDHASSSRRPASAASLRVIHRCGSYIAVDKPADMRIDSGRHGANAEDPNVIDILREIVDEPLGSQLRPCHQLDYATSGVLLYALSKKAAASASMLFEKREAKKQYTALLRGHVAVSSLRCDEPICKDPKDDFKMMCGDKDEHWPLLSEAQPAAVKPAAVKERQAARKHSGEASTTLKVLGRGHYRGIAVTKVELTPLTGRRHQLRLHCAHLGFPIVGDATYDAEEAVLDDFVGAPRMMLHAHSLLLDFEANAGGRTKNKERRRAEDNQGQKLPTLDLRAPDPFLPGTLSGFLLGESINE